MTRTSVRKQIAASAGASEGRVEYVDEAARVWATDTTRRVPLLFRQRLLYDLAIADHHLVLLPRRRRLRLWPRRRHRADPAVTIPYSSLTIVHVRRIALLLQVRLATEHGPEQLVLEFRPTDRGVARSLVDRIHQTRTEQPV